MKMKKKRNFDVVREDNYTITVLDSKKRSIKFRDITGKDLEFLEKLLGSEENKSLQIKDVIAILKRINISEIEITRLTNTDIVSLFSVVSENILCNYMPKIKWLEVCYALQNNSFVALEFFECQPMTKVMAMIQVHQAAIERLKKLDK